MSVTVTTEGVHIPDEYQDEDKVVIRTPNNTMDVSSGFSMMVTDGIYPLVTPADFTEDAEAFENPSLAPKQISLKAYGDDAKVFDVEVNT